MKQSKFYPAIVLSSICLAVALLLSVINYFTAPIIAERENKKANEALLVVLPDATSFDPLSLDGMPEGVIEAYSSDAGFVFRVSGAGRNGDIIVMVGIDNDGKIVGTKTISEKESAGYKEPVFAKVDGINTAYKGQSLETFETIIVSGGTMTSNGYSQAINLALRAFSAANGGDSRTPEQIFQDNCNAALGTTGLTFTKWFATEVFEGIDGIYESEGGRVFVIGEAFIGVNASGEIVSTEASEEDQNKAMEAHVVINGTLSDVTIPEGADEDIVSIKKTESGNYVIEAKGDGYGIKGGNKYHPASGEKLIIKVSISSSGAIIDSITIYENETPDFGGKVLSDLTFYEAYEGKTSSDYEGVANVSGATLTSKGYKDALKNAFAVFELLTAEGGND